MKRLALGVFLLHLGGVLVLFAVPQYCNEKVKMIEVCGDPGRRHVVEEVLEPLDPIMLNADRDDTNGINRSSLVIPRNKLVKGRRRAFTLKASIDVPESSTQYKVLTMSSLSNNCQVNLLARTNGLQFVNSNGKTLHFAHDFSGERLRTGGRTVKIALVFLHYSVSVYWDGALIVEFPNVQCSIKGMYGKDVMGDISADTIGEIVFPNNEEAAFLGKVIFLPRALSSNEMIE